MIDIATLNEAKSYTNQEITSVTTQLSNMAKLTINVASPPLALGLNACKIDGSTDDYTNLQAIFTYVKNNNLNVKIIIPKLTGSMLLSQAVTLDTDNVELRIYANIQLTDTSFNYAIKIGNDTTKRTGVKVIGDQITIDGNGLNMGVLNYVVGATQSYCCLYASNIDGLVIEGVKFVNGLVECCVLNNCTNISVDNCEFKGSLYDNGLSIYNTPSWIAFDENNPLTWTNAVVKNCKAENCVDFGFTSFKAVNVLYDSCTSTNCGNYTDSGQASLGDAGGYSVENYNIARDAKIKYRNCKAIGCIGKGWYADADGVELDEFCEAINIVSAIKSGYTPTPDNYNNIDGIGFRGSNHTNLKIKGKFRNCAGKAVCYQSWNSATTSNIEITNVTIDGSNRQGIYASGCDTLKLFNIYTINTNLTNTTNAVTITNIKNLFVSNTCCNAGTGLATLGIVANVLIVKANYDNPKGLLSNDIYCTQTIPTKFGGSYLGNHILIGSQHIWENNNELLIKKTAPKYPEDGAILFNPYTSLTLIDNATTIDVTNADLIVLNNTAATALQTINGYASGKIITLISYNNSNTTLKFSYVGQGIRTKTQADVVLSQNVPIRLQYFNYSWYQL